MSPRVVLSTCRAALAVAAMLGLTCAGAQVRNGELTVQTTSPAGALSVPLSATATTTVAAQLPTTFVGPTPANNGPATVTVSGNAACGAVRCGFAQSAFGSPSAGGIPPVAGYGFPHGVFSAVLGECAIGEAVQLQYTFSAPLPAGTTYQHFGSTPDNRVPHWHALPATVNGNTITVALTDGATGDEDLTRNGVLALRGGPAVPTAGPTQTFAEVPVGGAVVLAVLAMLLLAAGVWTLRRHPGAARALMVCALLATAAAAWWTHGVLTATAQGTSPLTATPPTLSFPPQDLGRVSGASRVVVANGTGASVALGAISVTSDFEQINDCPAMLDPGASCSIDVRFVTTACASPPPPPPPPVLSSASPPTLVANGQPQTLTLTGQNFVTGAVVLSGAITLTPNALTATSINVTIPGAQTAAASTLTLRVRNPDLQQSGTLDVPVIAPGALVLTQLTPNELPAYGFAHRVNLVGQGFAPGAVAVIAGTAVTPVSGNATLLVVDVPGSMLEQVATLPTLVRNPDAATSNPLPLAVIDVPPGDRQGPQPLAIKILDPPDNAAVPLSIIPVSGSHVGAERIAVGRSCTAAQVSGDTFFAAGVPLAYGDNLITAIAFGKSGATAIDVVKVRSEVPSIAMDPKLMDAQIDDDSVLVTGTYLGPPGAVVTVNGVRAMVTGSTFSALVSLDFGPNTVQATVVTPDAKTATATATISNTLPAIEITSPATGLQVAADRIDAAGTFVGSPSTAISINGIAATKSGNTFSVKDIPLVHSRNVLKATAISPTGRTVSRSVMVLNMQPSLTIASPADGATIGAPTVAVRGVVTAKQGTNREQAVVTVNGVVAARSGNRGPWVPDPPAGNLPYGDGSRYLIQDYTATVPLVAGANKITATVVAPNGQTLTREITVFRPDTVLAIREPADNALVYDDSVIVYGRVDGTASAVQANGVLATRSGNDFAVRVPLSIGPNVINVVATTSGGPVPLALHVTRGTLGVTFVSPVPGQVIGDTVTQARGTYVGPADASITVNGVVAFVINGMFFANNVPLRPGPNTLTATVTAPGNKTATGTVDVTRSAAGPAPIAVVVDPGEGIAPHHVRVYVMNNTGSPVTQTDIETNENGVGNQILTFGGARNAFRVDYPSWGIYQMRIVVSTADGNSYQVRQFVRVRTMDEVDTDLRNVFNGMLTRLRARDIDGAMSAITGSSSARYYAIFKTLSLPAAVDQVGTLLGGSVSGDIAEYVLVRETANGPQAFLIYFLRGEDGLWRIDSM